MFHCLTSLSPTATSLNLISIETFNTVEADVAYSVSVWPSELESRQFDSCHSIDVCFSFPLFRALEADVANSVSAWPSELEGCQFDPRHSIDVCFDFPLFHIAVALNTPNTEHGRRKGRK